MIELTINVVLKFFHILGLMLGTAAGFGSMFVARQTRRAAQPSPDILALRPILPKLGLAGIVLLWLTGLGLWFFRYDLTDLGPAYSTKILVSLILLAVIVTTNLVNRHAAKTGAPLPAWLPKLGMSMPVLTLTAMGLGVWVFI